MKPLPVGIQTFGDIVRGGFLYDMDFSLGESRFEFPSYRYLTGQAQDLS